MGKARLKVGEECEPNKITQLLNTGAEFKSGLTNTEPSVLNPHPKLSHILVVREVILGAT